MASARLTLNESHNSIQTHDLVTITPENRAHQLPLFGHFCCRLAVQPDCITSEVLSGAMSVSDAKHTTAKSYWGQLQAFRLDLWETQQQWEKGRDHVRSIMIDRSTIIKENKNCHNEITIINRYESMGGSIVDEIVKLHLKQVEEKDKWFRVLNAHAEDHLLWKHSAEDVMHIQTPGTQRNSFNRSIRQGSLYDETPLIGK